MRRNQGLPAGGRRIVKGEMHTDPKCMERRIDETFLLETRAMVVQSRRLLRETEAAAKGYTLIKGLNSAAIAPDDRRRAG